VRRGGFYTVYIWAFIYYIVQFRGKYDIVIDSENGIPFFTPLYVRKPIIGLIHHVHQEVILTELKLSLSQIPVAYVAKLLEAKLMPIVYANVKMITVSESSKRDMEKIGLGKHHIIDIVNPGIEPSRFYTAPKSKHPTILYVGRLKAYKRLDTLIRAMKYITKEHPKAKLIIAGFGESRSYLEKLVKNMGIEDSVEFLGKIDDDTRSRLLAEAWVFAYPSSMEGWGISIIEANASGTAVVASDVPGLMDSVNNYETGYLVKISDEVDFAEKISMLIKDHKQRKYMEENALLWAKKHTWELSAKKLISHMHALVNDAHEYADATNEVLAEEETTYGRH
jgi:glycosyltransferase involved in cell wall biosynthesis